MGETAHRPRLIDSAAMKTRAVALAIAFVLASIPATAQWKNISKDGLPLGPDGKVKRSTSRSPTRRTTPSRGRRRPSFDWCPTPSSSSSSATRTRSPRSTWARTSNSAWFLVPGPTRANRYRSSRTTLHRPSLEDLSGCTRATRVLSSTNPHRQDRGDRGDQAARGPRRSTSSCGR